MREEVVQQQVADYLKMQYPDVLFHSDTGSLTRLTPRQGAIRKRQNGGRRGWPDMFIAKPKQIITNGYPRRGIVLGTSDEGFYCAQFAGLFLELKKDGETLYPGPRTKKRFKSIDGKEYKTEHLMEQADVLYELLKAGYVAEFAVGLDKAKEIIDEYLGGKNG